MSPPFSRNFKRMPSSRFWLMIHFALLQICLGPLSTLLSAQPAGFTQSNQDMPPSVDSFDVSVIKPSSHNDSRFAMKREAWGISAHGVTLRDLMMTAYGLRESQIQGGPEWARSTRFDVTAKRVNQADALPEEQLRAMLQSLLAERFQLSVHWESKDHVPAYNLTVAKSGPKFPISQEPARRIQKRSGAGERYVTMTKASMPVLLNILTNALGRPISDQTNLTGEYDISLKWTSEEALLTGSNKQSNLPPLTVALQEQLGLKLTTTKGTLGILAIDRAEKPGPN